MEYMYTVGFVASRTTSNEVLMSYGICDVCKSLQEAQESTQRCVKELLAGTFTWDENAEVRAVVEDSFDVSEVSATARLVTFVNILGDFVEINLHIGEVEVK